MVDACYKLSSIDRAACRHEVEARFSSRAMAQGYVDIYNRVARRIPEAALVPPLHILRPAAGAALPV